MPQNTEMLTAEGDSAVNSKPASDETSDVNPTTTSASSVSWNLHLSVTPTWGNRTLPTSSPEWKALRKEILLRDNRTCASCGYASPHPLGRAMIIDHKDGNASNNDTSNLRVHCPPCETIRHCGFAGLKNWLVLAVSSMEQVKIVIKTREIFENTGKIPHPKQVDPSCKLVDMDILELANIMLKTPWEDLPENLRRLRGFFTKFSYGRFQDTMSLPGKGGDNNREIAADSNVDFQLNKSDARATEIRAIEESLPWIRYSPELHKSSQAFLERWRPSETSNKDVAWIYVNDPRATRPQKDPEALSAAWDQLCDQRQASRSELDKLAEKFNVISGKWLVFATSDKVDNVWARIVKATLAGTLGTAAKVSPHNKEDPAHKHVICVYNADYRSETEVNKVRDGLRRLGMKEPIGYKPDAYTHCRVYAGNIWRIPPTRYRA